MLRLNPEIDALPIVGVGGAMQHATRHVSHCKIRRLTSLHEKPSTTGYTRPRVEQSITILAIGGGDLMAPDIRYLMHGTFESTVFG